MNSITTVEQCSDYLFLSPVHNMKFRTKSGATICAPSVLQKTSLQQQNHAEATTPHIPTIKRKAEDPACDDMKRQKIGRIDQVWPLAQFFPFPFCTKSLICLEGKSMTSRLGNTFLLSFLLATLSSPSRTHEGFLG